jgi:hypothetical protein
MSDEAKKRGESLRPARKKGTLLSVRSAQAPLVANPLQNQAQFTKGNKKSRKRERGVSEGSSLRLKTPENAVMAPSVSVLLEHGTPSITVDIGVTRTLIVDTGSSVSLMQPSISKSEMSHP